MTGVFEGTLDFGSGPLVASGQNFFVAKLGAGGEPLWSRQWTTKAAFGYGTSVALDPGGNVFFAGTTANTIDFGGGPRCVKGFLQTFLVKLDPQGNHLWSRCFGDGIQSTGNWARVAADPDGNAVLAATTYGPIDFGTGPLTSGSVVVASYDPAGNTRWAEALGGAGSEDAIAFSVAVDAMGNVVVGGSLFGTVDLGAGPLTSGQGRDAFVVALDPGGSPLWTRVLGGAGDQTANGVAVDAAGRVVVTSSPFESIDLGGGQVVAQAVPSPIMVAFDAAGHLSGAGAPLGGVRERGGVRRRRRRVRADGHPRPRSRRRRRGRQRIHVGAPRPGGKPPLLPGVRVGHRLRHGRPGAMARADRHRAGPRRLRRRTPARVRRRGRVHRRARPLTTRISSGSSRP